MNSIRIAVAAATFAAISSVAIASDANAGQTFGRETVSAQGKSVAAVHGKTQYANLAPGRAGGVSLDAKRAVVGNAKVGVRADLVGRFGRA